MQYFKILHASDLHHSALPKHLCPASSVSRGFMRRAIGQGHAALSCVFQGVKRGRLSAAYPSNHDSAMGIAMAEYIQNRDDLDAVIFTGDISATGDEDDLKAAREFLAGQRTSYEVSSGNLFDLSIPLIFMPGNHDRFRWPKNITDRFRPWTPRSDRFETVFGDEWGGQYQPALSLKRPRRDGNAVRTLVVSKGVEKLAVICADFSLSKASDASGVYGYLGQGIVVDDILNELVRITTLYSDDNEKFAVIWAIHFSPYNFGDRDLELLYAKKVRDAANGAGVEAIMCGHFHDGSRYCYDVDNEPVVFCAGSATCIERAEMRDGDVAAPVMHELTVPIKDGRVVRSQLSSTNIVYKNTSSEMGYFE